jgi:hypothetical protein
MAKLTKEARDALPPEDFAVPGKRALPIHDADHIRMAWNEVGNTKGLTTSERREARQKIIERAKKHGIDTSDWEKGRLNASMTLSAMALNIATDDGHPNKMPFKGILTRIDQPSDAPPEGSGGKLITISAEAAEKALASILGMAVDYKPNLDGHDPKAKIGVITAATIDDDAIAIEGFIYAADFPDVAAEIKASKDVLGFSYETRNLYTNDPDANPVVITDCTFTGAAILRKDKAAYRTTSISASADEVAMNEEMKKMLESLTAGLAGITTQLATVSASVTKLETDKIEAANMLPKIEPHAAKLEAAADGLEAAGIGGDASNGHAVILRKMAGHLRAEAAQGRMPAAFHGMYAAAAVPAKVETVDLSKQFESVIKPITDKLAAFGTQIADLKAAATAASPAPERKTLSPQITALLAKSGIEMPAATGEKISGDKLDGAIKEMAVGQRLIVKTSLRQAGLID